MDNLTHSLTGLVLSRAGLDRLHPRAKWLLLASANGPDVDFVSMLAGADTYFIYHRWATHAILFVPIVALLPVIGVRLAFWKKPFDWKWAYVLSIIGVASHLILDWTNPYGIRLFLPFSDAWPALHSTSVVDIWIWTILLLAILWPMLSRLVGSEIGSRAKPGRGWAIAALVLFAVYNTGRWFIYQRAVEVQEALVYNGQAARRATAMPTHINPLVWKGVVETNSFWVLQEVNLARDLDPAQGRIIYKPESSPAIDAARKTRLFDVFSRFSRTLHWRVTPDPDIDGGTRVEAVDLRFNFTRGPRGQRHRNTLRFQSGLKAPQEPQAFEHRAAVVISRFPNAGFAARRFIVR
jgi:inner membrane protein